VGEPSDIGDPREFRVKSLEESCASRYDEVIIELGFTFISMSFDLKIATQLSFFSIISRPKSIEIP
jgi:hypothetical protein